MKKTSWPERPRRSQGLGTQPSRPRSKGPGTHPSGLGKVALLIIFLSSFVIELSLISNYTDNIENLLLPLEGPWKEWEESYFLYGLSLKLLFSLFGPSVLVAKLVNLMATPFCVFPCFFIAKKLTGKNWLGFLFASLVVFNPLIVNWSTALIEDAGSLIFLQLSAFALFLHSDSKKVRFLTGFFCFLCLVQKSSSIPLVALIFLFSLKKKKYSVVLIAIVLFIMFQIPFVNEEYMNRYFDIWEVNKEGFQLSIFPTFLVNLFVVFFEIIQYTSFLLFHSKFLLPLFLMISLFFVFKGRKPFLVLMLLLFFFSLSVSFYWITFEYRINMLEGQRVELPRMEEKHILPIVPFFLLLTILVLSEFSIKLNTKKYPLACLLLFLLIYYVYSDYLVVKDTHAFYRELKEASRDLEMLARTELSEHNKLLVLLCNCHFDNTFYFWFDDLFKFVEWDSYDSPLPFESVSSLACNKTVEDNMGFVLLEDPENEFPETINCSKVSFHFRFNSTFVGPSCFLSYKIYQKIIHN